MHEPDAGAPPEAAPDALTVEGDSATPAEATAPELGLLRVLRDDGSADPQSDPGLPAETLIRAYREMKRVRLIDTRMMLLQRQGRIHFAGECRGQEATPIATALVLDKPDWVFPALRESSIMLARGFPLASYIAQYFGNAGDVLKGRQMPSHMSGRSVNQVAWSSCMATQLPHAVGAAWAAKLQGHGAITVGFVGDGGTSESDFHAALNFAGVYSLPCVIICQNNHWAISVPAAKQTASRTFAVKGRAYGIPSVRVDGNDLLAVYRVVQEAAARARSGGGPTFIEALTYRMGAHSSSDDPSRYREQSEVDTWALRDPIQRLRKHLLHRGLLDDAQDEALEEGLIGEIGAAIQEVEALGPPARETLFDDVYAEPPWHLAEQRAEVLSRAPVAPSAKASGH
jgi:pyruvate dehydrogenase E1 component alpha subunit